MTKVTSIKNGPLKVGGGVKVEDAQGVEKVFEESQDAWLCRCGKSANKPYCDGTHSKVGFKADK